MPLTQKQYREIFVENSGVLEDAEFTRVLKAATDTRRPLDQMLMERAFVAPHQLLQLLSDYFKVPSTELRVADIDPEVLVEVPENFASKHQVIPFGEDKDTLKIAMVDPSDDEALDALKALTSKKVKAYVTTELALKRALVLYSGSLLGKLQQITSQIESGQVGSGDNNDSTIVSLTAAILETAVLMEASDVHIEPFETEVIVRFRIDGLLRTIATLPTSIHSVLSARLKIQAELKVDQRRLPQDGRFTLNIKGQEINIRVSTVPSLWGEKIVMRVLPKEAHLFDMTNLGLLDEDLEKIKTQLKQPFGMILVCGPTGSGKTTSLYAFLQQIGTDRIDIVNISTIEDPIEYTIPRVTQIQTNPEIDLSFAEGLRALLRQDPDIIMVGEIRDTETADFAVRASLVGRLVLSSLHTNDAPGAIPRLLDMGIEPYLISSTLSVVIAQRLARKLCVYCRASYQPEADVVKDLNDFHDLDAALKVLAKNGVITKPTMEGLRFYQPTGCVHCDNTGYRGRTAVFEVLEMSDELRSAINNREDVSKIREIARSQGMKTMFEDGLSKVVLGTLDLKELLRVAYSSQIVR